jgi:thymidylate synthase
MRQYLDLIEKIKYEGEYKQNRTGVGTYSIFGTQLRFNMNDGFPLVTTKSVHMKSVIHELLWFISGNTNIKYLQDNGVRIWNEWADEHGNLGPVYGHQWRNWSDYRIGSYADMAAGLETPPEQLGYEWVATLSKTVKNENGEEYKEEDYGLYHRKIDQLQRCIDLLRNNPNDRRIIVSAWNPSVLPDDAATFSENVANGRQALPPCHAFYQFYHINGKLSLQMYQRSCDVPLGGPFNIASYAALLMMVAQVTGLEANELIWTIGDAHIYENQMDGINEQLTRTPYALPQLVLNSDCKEIDDFKFEDFDLVNYQHHPKIPMPVAV